MSGAPHADASTTAKTPGGNKDTSSQPSSTAAPQKQAAQLEEDDEFEDFPVEDWPAEDELGSSGAGAGTSHLWEESWDDDDTSDEFSVQLQNELKKMESHKRA